MGPVPNRGARAVAKKVCQTSGTDATGVAVARGNVKFKKMWQTSGSAKLNLKKRGKLVAVPN